MPIEIPTDKWPGAVNTVTVSEVAWRRLESVSSGERLEASVPGEDGALALYRVDTMRA